MIVQLEAWHWLLAAAVFVTLEIVAPGVFMLWFGIAAAFVSLISFAIPGMTWTVQLALFGVIALMSFGLGRAYVRQIAHGSEGSFLNRRAEQYKGQILVMETALVNGHGQARVGNDTVWSVMGPDLPAGARVRVVGSDGIVLKVESVTDIPENKKRQT
ncbi:MAG: NfeD family protein [Alphaproteobacteria bacterium]|nr:MAG: NfeD family protein [Alphaproteobacteria bacterium]